MNTPDVLTWFSDLSRHHTRACGAPGLSVTLVPDDGRHTIRVTCARCLAFSRIELAGDDDFGAVMDLLGKLTAGAMGREQDSV